MLPLRLLGVARCSRYPICKVLHRTLTCVGTESPGVGIAYEDWCPLLPQVPRDVFLAGRAQMKQQDKRRDEGVCDVTCDKEKEQLGRKLHLLAVW